MAHINRLKTEGALGAVAEIKKMESQNELQKRKARVFCDRKNKQNSKPNLLMIFSQLQWIVRKMSSSPMCQRTPFTIFTNFQCIRKQHKTSTNIKELLHVCFML